MSLLLYTTGLKKRYVWNHCAFTPVLIPALSDWILSKRKINPVVVGGDTQEFQCNSTVNPTAVGSYDWDAGKLGWSSEFS